MPTSYCAAAHINIVKIWSPGACHVSFICCLQLIYTICSLSIFVNTHDTHNWVSEKSFIVIFVCACSFNLVHAIETCCLLIYCLIGVLRNEIGRFWGFFWNKLIFWMIFVFTIFEWNFIKTLNLKIFFWYFRKLVLKKLWPTDSIPLQVN